MDVWSSPNHRAFVAWVVHLHHEGRLLMFVLDIREVPEVCNFEKLFVLSLTFTQSHTGHALACEFQTMLKTHHLEDKVLATIMDNVSSNNAQITRLAAFPNSIESRHRVHCFNHTMQLSAKALLAPFNATPTEETVDNEDSGEYDVVESMDESDGEGGDEEDMGDGGASTETESEEVCEAGLLEDTEHICATLGKVSSADLLLTTNYRDFRFENYLLPSYTPPPSPSLLGVRLAGAMTSKSASSRVT
jgi:hypothetical protein